jgi:hypothetical protein
VAWLVAWKEAGGGGRERGRGGGREREGGERIDGSIKQETCGQVGVSFLHLFTLICWILFVPFCKTEKKFKYEVITEREILHYKNK